jgi:sugar phosphate permease
VTSRPEGLARHQALTILLLFLGYGAYYFCRADLSVATPLLVDELGRHGLAPNEAMVHLGTLASAGVFAYALGKLFLTGIADLWGGRLAFLMGLGGAALFTLAFAAGGSLPVFTLAWLGNRLVQSIGWAGLLKVSSKWFNFSSYGAIIGLLSVSYLVGDAIARPAMGAMIAHGFGWRALFVFAAAVAAFMLVANFIFLRESRSELGHAPAVANPLNLFAHTEERPARLRDLLGPLLRSRAFLLVCLLSFGCTVVRETFNFWTPQYLHGAFGYSPAEAATLSAVFPGVGVISVLGTGWFSDRLGVIGRPAIMFSGLTAAAATLLVLAFLPGGAHAAWLAVALIGLVAFCLLGPYSYLGGAFALDFGGLRAGAAASGIIDGVGYLGGALAGDSVARLAVAFGWRGVFVALALVCGASALAAATLFQHQRRLLVAVEKSHA